MRRCISGLCSVEMIGLSGERGSGGMVALGEGWACFKSMINQVGAGLEEDSILPCMRVVMTLTEPWLPIYIFAVHSQI